MAQGEKRLDLQAVSETRNAVGKVRARHALWRGARCGPRKLRQSGDSLAADIPI
jgi:hypothetical protein